MKVLILEKNPVPGGAVTTFYRKGFPIDIIHSISGCGKNSFLGKIFDYLSIYDKLDFVEQKIPFIYFSNVAKTPIFYNSDLGIYKHDLKILFSKEKENIDNLIDKMEYIWSNEVLKSYYNPSFLTKCLYPVRFPNIFKYRKDTFDSILNNFTKSAELKEVVSIAWPYLGLEKEYVSGLYLLSAIMAHHKEKSYFIKKGFGKISEILTSNFMNLGGKINYNCMVKRLLMKNKNFVSSVEDNHGNTYRANRIISNIDTKKTFFDLIDSSHFNRAWSKKIKKLTLSCSSIHIHLVVEADIEERLLSAGTILFHPKIDPEGKLRMILKENLTTLRGSIMGFNIHSLQDYVNTTENSTYILNIIYLPANYLLWKNFVESCSQKEYEDMKEEIANITLSEIKDKITVKRIKFSNVLTPLSYEKWLNYTDGAIYDVALTPRQSLLNRLSYGTFINNLFLVGAKTFPGNSVASVASSALSLSDMLLGGLLTKGRWVL